MFSEDGLYAVHYRNKDITENDCTMAIIDLRFTEISDAEKLIDLCKFRYHKIVKNNGPCYYWSECAVINQSPEITEWETNKKIREEEEARLIEIKIDKINSLPKEFHLFPDIIEGLHIYAIRDIAVDDVPDWRSVCNIVYTVSLPTCTTEAGFKLARALETSSPNGNYKYYDTQITNFMASNGAILVQKFLSSYAWNRAMLAPSGQDMLVIDKFNDDRKLIKEFINSVHSWSSKVQDHIRSGGDIPL